jgi:peptide deformylase
MSVLEILTIPDKRLKHKSSEVENFDKSLEKIVKDLFDTLYSSGNGIGLAAPQVGIKKRIVVIDLKEEGKSVPITFINPKIIFSSDENSVNEEGCLSIPGYYAEIKRPNVVEVEWTDLDGKKNKDKLTGLMSICIQHEIDHLDGILFIDYLSNLKKKRAQEKVKKYKKNNEKTE